MQKQIGDAARKAQTALASSACTGKKVWEGMSLFLTVVVMCVCVALLSGIPPLIPSKVSIVSIDKIITEQPSTTSTSGASDSDTYSVVVVTVKDGDGKTHSSVRMLTTSPKDVHVGKTYTFYYNAAHNVMQSTDMFDVVRSTCVVVIVLGLIGCVINIVKIWGIGRFCHFVYSADIQKRCPEFSKLWQEAFEAEKAAATLNIAHDATAAVAGNSSVLTYGTGAVASGAQGWALGQEIRATRALFSCAMGKRSSPGFVLSYAMLVIAPATAIGAAYSVYAYRAVDREQRSHKRIRNSKDTKHQSSGHPSKTDDDSDAAYLRVVVAVLAFLVPFLVANCIIGTAVRGYWRHKIGASFIDWPFVFI